MITLALLIWIGVKIGMTAGYFVLCGIAVIFLCIRFGVNLYDKLK